MSSSGRTSGASVTQLWRRASDPAAARDLADRGLEQAEYVHTRGVAQQAARLARPTHLARSLRQHLLAAAWLHRLGRPPLPALGAARALRRAGHEQLARVVACAGPTPELAAMLDLEPIALEFPRPRRDWALLVGLLEIAVVTTDPGGGRTTPAGHLRALVATHGPEDPAVRALVRVVARIGDDTPSRALLELVVPRSVAS